MTKRVKAVLVGAGKRGNFPFGQYALDRPDQLQFVAVVEPDDERRANFARKHHIPKKNSFSKVKEFIKSGINVNVAFNATMDKKHLYTTLSLLRKGFSVLLEKPIATTPEACIQLYEASKKKNCLLMIAHELRYTLMFSEVSNLLKQGKIGKLLVIEHVENIGNWHFVHSYVRGNWRSKKSSAPILLTKTCHDFDLLYWLTDREGIKSIRAESDPLFFCAENAPCKTPKRCSPKCPIYKKCLYYAPRFYLDPKTFNTFKRAIDIDLRPEKIKQELKTGKYGRCVYHCDNDVHDYIMTDIVLKSGARIHFKMSARTPDSTRKMRLIGTKGTIYCNLIKSELIIESIDDVPKAVIPPNLGMHGGGDELLISDFIDAVNGDVSVKKTDISDSIESHLISFAAEESRTSGKTVNFKRFKNRVMKNVKSMKGSPKDPNKAIEKHPWWLHIS